MAALRPEPFDRAKAVARQLRAEGWPIPHPERIECYGIGGTCLGPVAIEDFHTIPNLAAFFTAWAARTGAPNAARLGATLAALCQMGRPGGARPDDAAIAREWDGALIEAHRSQLIPRISEEQDAFDRRVFWREAAWLAAMWYGGGERRLAWTAVRCIMAEMEGLSPNPFAPYLGLAP